MSAGVEIRVLRKAQPQPAAIAAGQEAGQEAGEMVRQDPPDLGEAAASRGRWLLGGTAVAVVAALALTGLPAGGGAAGAGMVDRADGLSPALAAQLKANAAALEKNGLRKGTIRLRDWGAIDGDAAVVNGVFVGPLQKAYTGLAVGAGPLTITAKAGSMGCVSAEIADDAGAVYQVCVEDGAPIRTFAH